MKSTLLMGIGLTLALAFGVGMGLRSEREREELRARLERVAPICDRVHDDVALARTALRKTGSTHTARGLDPRIFVEIDACSPTFNDRAYEDAMNTEDVRAVGDIYDRLLHDTTPVP